MLHGQFEPGAILAGRYRIVSLLGNGGMGEVYRADDLMLKEPVALKILPKELGNRRSVLEALRNEVKQARQVSHRHVCRVHDIGEIEGRPLLSMEFIEGEDLASLLRRIGQLPAAKGLQLARQLAAGLNAAHEEGVLHLDLKPANLMIDRKGDIKISDFGLARLASSVEEERRIAGTPAYMAPEQALGGDLSPRVDIYAFGLILYEMFTGRRAFEERRFEEIRSYHTNPRPIPPPSAHAKDIAPVLEQLILSCLEPDAGRRPESFEALSEALDSIGDDEDGGALVVDAGENPESSIEESDVYLSFAPVDDQPLSAERKGWITQFHRNLEIRVEQLTGRQVRVFRPPRQLASDEPNTEMLAELPGVKAMVSVLSPPFVHSSGCLREVEAFWESNARDGRLYVDGHTRVLKVVKTPVVEDDLPPALREKMRELLGFEFFEYDAESGRLREYAEWFGAEAEQRFHERVYDLAQEINELFKAMGKLATLRGRDAPCISRRPHRTLRRFGTASGAN